MSNCIRCGTALGWNSSTTGLCAGCQQKPIVIAGSTFARVRLLRIPTDPTHSARLLTAVDTVLKTFRKDEAQGFRSRDRAFAIDVLGQAVASAPASERSRTVALSMEDAAAIHRWLELVIDDRKFFNPVEAALTERATVGAKGRLAAELAKR